MVGLLSFMPSLERKPVSLELEMKPRLTLCRFWAFLYVQNRHDICKYLMQLAASLTLTLIVPVQNYITAIIIFLIVEQLMTWGFYGQSTYPTHLSRILTLFRLPEPSRLQHRSKGTPGHRLYSQRRPKLLFLLSPPHRLHGLRRREAQPRQNHDLRPLPCHRSLRFRCLVCRGQLIRHAR